MKLKLSERLGYSAGYFSISIFNDTISIYLLAFFTNLLGLSPLVAGNIFLVARIWDAINDPMMGTLADRTRSKYPTDPIFCLAPCRFAYFLFYVFLRRR